MPREERPPATLSQVRDALERLSRDVGALRSDVGRLNGQLARLPKAKDGRFDDGWRRSDMTSTPPPRSEILTALYGAEDDLPTISRILKGTAKDIEGALLDVRAARLSLQSIDDEPETRAAFRSRGGSTRK